MDDQDLLRVIARMGARRRAGKALLLLGLAAAFGALTYFIPGDPRDAGVGRMIGFSAAALVLAVAGVAMLMLSRTPRGAQAERLAEMWAERRQSRRRVEFLLFPVSLTLMLPGVIRAVSRAAGAPMRHLDIFILGAFVFFLVMFAIAVARGGLDRWKRGALDDELDRAFRGQALQLGYGILLIGVGALFILGLFRRDLAIELTPVIAAVGVAGPSVRLYMLDRSASAGGEG